MNYFIKTEKLKLTTPDKVTLVDGLSFTLNEGSLLLITGPNGSGKSSLLKAILGDKRFSKGKVENTFPRKQIVVIPQLQNMEFHLPLTLKEVIENSENKHMTIDSITQEGLLSKEILERSWNTASGGERQRTLLTCALLRKPRLLVLDEPFNHLDSLSQTKMLDRIEQYLSHKDQNRAAILVSHLGIEEMARFGSKLVRLTLEPKERTSC